MSLRIFSLFSGAQKSISNFYPNRWHQSHIWQLHRPQKRRWGFGRMPLGVTSHRVTDPTTSNAWYVEAHYRQEEAQRREDDAQCQHDKAQGQHEDVQRPGPCSSLMSVTKYHTQYLYR